MHKHHGTSGQHVKQCDWAEAATAKEAAKPLPSAQCMHPSIQSSNSTTNIQKLMYCCRLAATGLHAGSAETTIIISWCTAKLIAAAAARGSDHTSHQR
jgi:hypothetical protein